MGMGARTLQDEKTCCAFCVSFPLFSSLSRGDERRKRERENLQKDSQKTVIRKIAIIILKQKIISSLLGGDARFIGEVSKQLLA